MKVKDGFGRNFLLPKKKALRATKANLVYFETQRAQLETRNLEHRKEAAQIGEKLKGKTFVLLRQAGDRGQLYGSVSPRDIADIVTAMEGPIGMTECSAHAGSCGHEPHCGVRVNWQRINQAIAGALESVTLADMVNPPSAKRGATIPLRVATA